MEKRSKKENKKSRLNKRKKLNKKKVTIIVLSILALIIISIITGYFIKLAIYGDEKKLSIKLKEGSATIEALKEYKEAGAIAKYRDKDISKDIKIKGTVDTKKPGEYTLYYTIKYKKISKTIKRVVSVEDHEKPVIELNGNTEVEYFIGTDYNELGYTANDNVDGDITNKVQVTNTIEKDKVGEYEVRYSVTDSSNNTFEVVRKVKYIAKPVFSSSGGKIAVLNYHFFYDPDQGEACNENICEKVSDFRSHLDYLKNNGFKTLTMEEFRKWMYGEEELPEKSVLITIDDGAMGTGKHNGNKLIPILEEYKMHATLFLITGWWDINNYRSSYLDIESHTNDMHTGGYCNIANGARIVCSDYDFVLNDLRQSMAITNSNKAFCFPFYVYNDTSIKAVKEVGFKLAFIGGSRKASRADDKWHIPRYPIHKNTTLEQFIKMVN